MSEDFKPKERTEATISGGRAVFEIDEAHLLVALSLYPDESGQPFFDEEIDQQLAALRVVRGIDSEQIQEAISLAGSAGEPVERVIVARGEPSVRGRDAYLEYPVLDHLPKTDVDPEDPIQLCETRIVNIRSDETIAVFHPPEEGTGGINVRGETIPVQPSVDATPKPGRQVRWENDGIVSDIDGRLVMDEKSIHVNDTVEFEGDLTSAFGDVDFVAKIIVKQNIESGLKIRTGGDIEVHGSVIGSDIHCEGNLIVGNGIVGSEETIIEVRNDLEALFVENANLRVWGSCRIKDSFVTSSLLCSDSLDMSEGRGHFVSGTASTRNGITVQSIGILIGTKAKLSVGRDNLAKTRMEEVEEELERLENQLNEIKEVDSKAGPMTKLYQKLTPGKRDEIELLLEQIPRLEQIISERRDEHGSLKGRIAPAYDAIVTVHKQVCPDAIIEFPLGFHRVSEELLGVVFKYDDQTSKVEQVAAA